ncbi:hypothetical protein NLJ89_g8889 [Agrocybe chaxingu]|uniref:Uncharacterized protein n=1 Tax=Agrocybe chaxingu TaxID=84603 RepID=A0A9W8MRR1_9AGAR|nr:hypothetical protein NLJ89_g8889 [Agrocybe chaxingu]
MGPNPGAILYPSGCVYGALATWSVEGPKKKVVEEIHTYMDILDLIVDELASSMKRYDHVSRSALTSCALVSKSMSARARGHLFSTISLCWDPVTSTTTARHARIRALKHIMEADPQFVSFVRTLELALSQVLQGADDPEGLPGVLTMLYSTPRSGLHSLQIIMRCAPVLPHHVWPDIDGAGRKAFINLCLSGCLTELVIHGVIRDPILLLAKIPKGLVSMELREASFSPIAPESGMGLDVGDREGAKLEKLVVDDVSSTALFANLEAGSALRTRILAMMQELKTLELERVSMWTAVRHFAFAPVLQQCKRSLQRLLWSVDVQDQISTILSHVPLSSFTALQSLTFKIWTEDGTVLDVNTRHIFSAIQESAMPSLEHLAFAIRLRSTQSRRSTIDDLINPATGWGWEALDVALASAVQYPWLGLVEMGIVDRPATEEAYMEEARGHLEALFPSILARGVNLKISFKGVCFCNGRP